MNPSALDGTENGIFTLVQIAVLTFWPQSPVPPFCSLETELPYEHHARIRDDIGPTVTLHKSSSVSWQICTPDLVVFLACTNHRLKERLHKRAEQQGRPDDNPKAIDRRLTNFKQNTIPLVKYFQERGLIVTVRLTSLCLYTLHEEWLFCARFQKQTRPHIHPCTALVEKSITAVTLVGPCSFCWKMYKQSKVAAQSRHSCGLVCGTELTAAIRRWVKSTAVGMAITFPPSAVV